MTLKEQPVDNVVWRDRDTLAANDYNPNRVANREMDLLAHSIISDGWTQPIVITPSLDIVDGFHRWAVSERPEIKKLTGGKVPTVTLRDTDPSHLRMATIRHNRARGTHLIIPMGHIVEDLQGAGLESKQIQQGLGMESEEIRRLTDHSKSIAEQYAGHEPTQIDV